MRLTVNGTAMLTRNVCLSSRRLPEIKNTRSAYVTPARNRQRNNNRKQVGQRQLSPSQLEPTAQRILSARQHKIIDQTNIINDLKKQIDLLKTENRTLKSQSYKQEKALNKIESRQTDLPQILEHHEAEVSNLREQIRKLKDCLNCEIKHRKDGDSEISKLKLTLAKAQSLVNDKGLGERSYLQTQLNDTVEKLENSENSLANLQKHLEHVDKGHKRDILILKKLNKQYLTHCQKLEEELKLLKINLKEKEKLLEIQNIYSHRIKMPHRLPGSATDQRCATCNNYSCHEKHLDKLNFYNYTSTGSNKRIEENADLESYCKEDVPVNYLDPEKIKEDIRKILEEEIQSGRIKPVQYKDDDANITFNIEYQTHESDKESQATVECPEINSNEDNHSTGRTLESDKLSQEVEEEKPRLVNKESVDFQGNMSIKIERKNSQPETADIKSDLKYSYPITDQILATDVNTSDIETISANATKSSNAKTYKFNEVIENLHNGLPTVSDGDVNTKCARRRQSNNSMIESGDVDDQQNGLTESTSLPPLTEEERQLREKELMTELFGDSYAPPNVVHGRPYPHGNVKGRNSNIPLWQTANNEFVNLNDDKTKSYFVNNDYIKSRNSSIIKSEDIEEIVL